MTKHKKKKKSNDPHRRYFISHALENVYVISVVAQDYSLEVRVINGGSAKGCSAVLECVAPTFMKDLVKVVSWLQEPGFYIYPSLQGGW